MQRSGPIMREGPLFSSVEEDMKLVGCERGREDSMEADDWIWEQMCSYFTEQSFLMFEI